MNAGGFQFADGYCGIGLDAVADDDVAGILSVDGHMDDGAFVVAGTPGGAHLIHELAVAHGHLLSVDQGHDAMAGAFLDILHAAVVLLVGVGVPQRHGNGMGGVPLHVGGQVKEFLLVNHFRMNGRHFEHALGEGAGLVKDHGLQTGQFVHEVGALDEDAFFGSSA